MIHNVQLMIDCVDPDEIMRFWGRALQYDNPSVRMAPDELREWRKDYPQFDGRGRIDDDQGRRMSIYIEHVPEPKATRNRLRPEIARTGCTSTSRQRTRKATATDSSRSVPRLHGETNSTS